jgi:hypothetical protein
VQGDPRLKGTPYEASDYFALNFDTFPNAMVTLFCCMVVNNWHVIASGPVALWSSSSSSWWAATIWGWLARAYFVAFYLVAVVLVVHVVIALFIDIFATQIGLDRVQGARAAHAQAAAASLRARELALAKQQRLMRSGFAGASGVGGGAADPNQAPGSVSSSGSSFSADGTLSTRRFTGSGAATTGADAMADLLHGHSGGHEPHSGTALLPVGYQDRDDDVSPTAASGPGAGGGGGGGQGQWSTISALLAQGQPPPAPASDDGYGGVGGGVVAAHPSLHALRGPVPSGGPHGGQETPAPHSPPHGYEDGHSTAGDHSAGGGGGGAGVVGVADGHVSSVIEWQLHHRSRAQTARLPRRPTTTRAAAAGGPGAHRRPTPAMPTLLMNAVAERDSAVLSSIRSSARDYHTFG